MTPDRPIHVCADWEGNESPQAVGTLMSDSLRGKEVFSFEYETSWLEQGAEFQLDPELALFGGRHFAGPTKANFGVFLDSCPDRWGRVLMQRREALEARKEGRPPRRLMESDYLLGVHDGHRMGALRFHQGGEFLDDNTEFASPPWTSLRALEGASRQLETAGAEDSPDYARWLRMLISPGSSLGGARPKASVTDQHGHLWVAKFPSSNDSIDVGAWEYVVRELGQRAGINMAIGRIERFSSRHRTYLSRRFDRTNHGGRLHLASAMTLLDRTDGADGSAGASYLELAEFIQRAGALPDSDLEQLWSRIAFSIAVTNTDDHLRNHAFLLGPEGWRLSPAYDVNPNPTGTGLTLNISDMDNALSWDLVVEVAPYFRVSDRQVRRVLDSIKTSVATWRIVATEAALGRAEIEAMETAFPKL